MQTTIEEARAAAAELEKIKQTRHLADQLPALEKQARAATAVANAQSIRAAVIPQAEQRLTAVKPQVSAFIEAYAQWAETAVSLADQLSQIQGEIGHIGSVVHGSCHRLIAAETSGTGYVSSAAVNKQFAEDWSKIGGFDTGLDMPPMEPGMAMLANQARLFRLYSTKQGASFFYKHR